MDHGSSESGMGYVYAFNQRALLDQIKQRHEPAAMRPVLCLTTPVIPSKKAEPLAVSWMFYAGMGQVSFKPLEEYELRSARSLLESGQIAPSHEARYSFNGLMHHPLKLIEDINWGIKGDSKLILFRLNDGVVPDEIIRADKRYNAAITEVQKRIDNGTACHDNPLRLDNGVEITPIVFGQQQVARCRRQNQLNPV